MSDTKLKSIGHDVRGFRNFFIYTANMDHVVLSGVINIKISVHLPIFMVKKKQTTPSSSSFITGRSYANYNKETFQNDIKNDPRWLNFWEIEENKPSELWEIIFEI